MENLFIEGFKFLGMGVVTLAVVWRVIPLMTKAQQRVIDKQFEAIEKLSEDSKKAISELTEGHKSSLENQQTAWQGQFEAQRETYKNILVTVTQQFVSTVNDQKDELQKLGTQISELTNVIRKLEAIIGARQV